MDNALAQIPPQPLAARQSAAADGTLARLAALPGRTKSMALFGVAALVAVLAAMAMWSREGDYKVLYANLSDKDGGAIIAQLSQMNVPYRHADGGSAILVPADKVHDVRLKLASAGLPKGSVVGFELMDNARFGQTQFQERLTFQRGLEGELTRSILALGSVAARRACTWRCRNQNGFFREQQKPQRLGAAHAAPRPHARSRAGRRHRAPGVVVGARAESQGRERDRPDRRAAVRLRPTPRPARAWTRSSCNTCSRSSRATSSA